MKKSGTKFKKGFSIAEVVLSVFIISVIVTGIASLIFGSMRHSMASRDNIIAAELAQEGIELVRNVRDNNLAQGLSAFNGFTANNYCRIDPLSSSINCGVGTSSSAFALLLNSSSNMYSHNSGSNTKFTRRISINGSGDTRTVYSTVSWNGGIWSISPGDANYCSLAHQCVLVSDMLTDR